MLVWCYVTSQEVEKTLKNTEDVTRETEAGGE